MNSLEPYYSARSQPETIFFWAKTRKSTRRVKIRKDIKSSNPGGKWCIKGGCARSCYQFFLANFVFARARNIQIGIYKKAYKYVST